MKEKPILTNPLNKGMIFKNSKEACKFIGYQDVSHSNQNYSRLSHYCKYHTDKKYNIYIDEVFEEVLPFRNLDYIYDLEDIIITKTGKVKVLDRYYTYDEKEDKNRKTYKCECLLDNHVFELFEHRIKDGVGCPVCGKRKLIPEVNSLYDEHPELLIYLKNIDDAKNVTSNSSKTITCICPFCGEEKCLIVNNFTRYGFSCSYCSDGISYPNKFVRNFLMQLNISYSSEKTFEWSNKKIYDQYIEGRSIIIENHGLQHYEERNSIFRTLKEEQENDRFKERIARENGILHYIVLDCRKSDKDWIKKSIMESELPILLNFNENDIDWDECDAFCRNHTIIREICDSWKLNHNITKLSKKYQLHVGTIRKYLVIGTYCGYCDFEVGVIEKNGLSCDYIQDMKRKPIYWVEGNMFFHSKNELEEYFQSINIKVCGKNIYNYINKNKKYKGMTFKYITKKEFNLVKIYSELHKENNVIGEIYQQESIDKEENKYVKK